MTRIAQAISGGYLVLVLIVIAWTAWFGPLPGNMSPPFGGMLGTIAGRTPVTITMAYGTEKEEWLQAALERFQAEAPRVGGRPIEVEIQGIGSRDMVNRIIQGELQPTVISPASMIQVRLLEGEWQARNNTSILHSSGDAPQPLVVTPLVVVAWEERAQVLELDQPEQLWENIHDVLADPQGWGAFGQPEWGLAKFGQTNPETSNSGIQTLVLLAYGYHNKTDGLSNADILDADFQAWLDDVQEAVLEFPDSTGTLMEDVVRFGPSKYDFVVVYENLAIDNIETAQGRWGTIRVYYPPDNILSDHPYAILNADWVTADQRAAAAVFRDFLLSDEIQELSLQYGFRPASPDVAFDSPDSPFTRFESYGVQTNINRAVVIPPAEVLNELINLWGRKNYN